MKKLILIALLFIPFLAKAEVPSGVFGFMDNKFYDVNQTLKYLCFMDGNCYGIDGNFAFSKTPTILPLTPVTNFVPAPIAEPVVTVIPEKPMFKVDILSLVIYDIEIQKDSVIFYDKFIRFYTRPYVRDISIPEDVYELTFNGKTYTNTRAEHFLNFIIGYRSGSLDYTPLIPNTSYPYILKVTRGDTYGIVSGTLTTLAE